LYLHIKSLLSQIILIRADTRKGIQKWPQQSVVSLVYAVGGVTIAVRGTVAEKSAWIAEIFFCHRLQCNLQ
jgi:hypothetical protein